MTDIKNVTMNVYNFCRVLAFYSEEACGGLRRETSEACSRVEAFISEQEFLKQAQNKMMAFEKWWK